MTAPVTPKKRGAYWPDPVERLDAYAVMTKAKRTGNWNKVTAASITYALLWEIQLKADEQTALPRSEKVTSIGEFRTLIWEAVEDWLEETIKSVPQKRLNMKAFIEGNVEYYRHRAYIFERYKESRHVYSKIKAPQQPEVPDSSSDTSHSFVDQDSQTPPMAPAV